jgi:sugar phosphate isomerase/epimerase
MNRRAFLGTMTGATAATLLTSRFSWALDPHVGKVGLQLYTVRGDMAKDFDGTLSKVAEVGYKYVELAEFAMDGGAVTYFKRSPKDMRAALDHHGLLCSSAHVNLKSLQPENFDKVIEASKVIGQQYIVNPWIDEDLRKQPDAWKRVSEIFNRAGEACKKAGLQFGYHNHWFEFIPANGTLPYDILLQQCDPNLVKMELDICWITVGRQDPVKYFERYPGRFPLIHAKDVKSLPPLSASGGQNFGDTLSSMTEVGSGMVDWKRIYAHAAKAGVKYSIVEHDYPKAPFESIRASYEYLENLHV